MKVRVLLTAVACLAAGSAGAAPNGTFQSRARTLQDAVVIEQGQTITLPATQLAACGATYHVGPVDYGCNYGTWYYVGYHYLSVLHTEGLQYEDVVRRLVVGFDETPLLHKSIQSAMLHLTVKQAWDGSSDIKADGTASVSCAARVALATSEWAWAAPSYAALTWIDGPQALHPGASPGRERWIDVTPMVREWAAGQKNYGLILEGESENLHIDMTGADGTRGKDNGTCLTYYAPPQLVVTFARTDAVRRATEPMRGR